ncbi:uncharacterized protein DUF5057 [Lachnotalea glycerini]|uniref:Uncharacterized protein DUF5057 n=1 Tax=Lachnotalea glycerini TaxID=1763509 RepID=A0A318EUQ8_9FIRM|nr:DUF5057 domain-containing protein [Lachnotalea glycerini]PXV93320.1 uncharacterized protein DUF5057 [Lachnotalea glycerini]
MKRNHKIFLKKNIVGMLGCVLTIVICLTLFKQGTVAVAKDTLPGVEEVIHKVTSTSEPFQILEIVPAKDMAELGYYVKGQEPIKWEEELLKKGSMAERKAYMDSLYQETGTDSQTSTASGLFSTIASTIPLDSDGNQTAPLLYVPYEEKTSLTTEEQESEEWKENSFTEPVTEVGLKGNYSLNPEKTGNYTKDVSGWNQPGVTFTFAPAGDGNYEPNILYYEKDSGSGENNYKIKFQYELQGDGGAGYQVSNEKILSSTDIASLEDEELIYTKSEEDKYEYAGTAKEIKEAIATDTKENKEDNTQGSLAESTIYYQVDFVYGENLSGDVYQVSESVYAYDSAGIPTGDYKAVLDTAQPYYETVGSGHFNISDSSLLVTTYTYTPGCGAYDWVEDKNADTVFDVTLAKVWYKGGFTNQDWMKKYVFDLDDDDFDSFSIEVTTLTPNEVNSCDLSEFDLIYISGVNTVFGSNGDSKYKVFDTISEGNDLTEETAEEIEGLIMSTTLPVPCIIDASVTKDSAMSDTNIVNLARNILNSSTDNDLHFVNNNVYSFDRNQVTLINKSFHQTFSAEEIEKGFSDVLNEIKSENLYRSSDTTGNYALFSEDISQAVCVKYIINYAYRRVTVLKTNIRILEIEPCASYELTSDTVKGWISNSALSEATITIDQITTAEFIGKIEDLNGIYDLIYIGTNTGRMNLKSDGSTKFNDETMDGLVYYHMGDLVNVKGELAGLLDTELNASGKINATTFAMRYSGNDITKDKYNALKDYVMASYPVVLSDDFYHTDGSINDNKIDTSSYLYKFANEMTQGSTKRPSVIQKSNIINTTSLLAFYLNRPKLEINLEELVDDGSDNNDQVYKLTADEDGAYFLDYYFSISNAGAVSSSAKYTCKLYIDINADGKYSNTEEIENIQIYDNNGAEADETNLSTGKRYHLNRAVPDGYNSVLPWKIEVSQNSNAYIRNSESGYSHIVPETKDQVTVKVLQINSASGSTLNLKTDSTFISLFQDVKDRFNIDIEITVTTTALFPKLWDANKDILKEYDMLIVGFADCFNEIDNTIGASVDTGGGGCVTGFGGILEFIQNGKSVLFTHDTTSFVNTTDRSGLDDRVFWGYNFNTYIREEVGMDRFGVLDNEMLKDGNSANDVIEELEALGKEVAYQPRSNFSSTVSQVQGYTYSTLNRYRRSTSTTSLYNLNYSGLNYSGNGAYGDAMKVTEVNKGQITTYPYNLEDNYLNNILGNMKGFTVSLTHAQYYQLDLEADDDNDGESDIVVWYCISDGKSGNDIYDASPNDVINNYYIYNKGNITYSGVGHSKITQQTEAKLFVNTMIASYNAGIKKPQISILEGASSSSAELENIYIPFDEVWETEEATENAGVLESQETLYFYVNDINFIKGSKKILANYYYEDSDGDTTITVNGTNVKVSPITAVTKLAGTSTQVEQDNLSPDHTYEITVPTSYLKSGKNSVTIYIEAQSEIYSYGSTKTTEKTYDTVGLVRTQLFDLK